MELFNGRYTDKKFQEVMKSVYIIFSTDDIGGAEKRFAGLWRSFQISDSTIQVKLVLHPLLHQRFIETNEISLNDENIIISNFEGKNFFEYRKKVSDFIKKFTAPKDIIHFIGISPLLIFPKRKIIFSLTNSSLNLGSKSNKNVILLSSLLANNIDVLDPGLFKKIRNIFFWKRKNIFRTPNSFATRNFSILYHTMKKKTG